jgi:hypothetical protein
MISPLLKSGRLVGQKTESLEVVRLLPLPQSVEIGRLTQIRPLQNLPL